MTEYWEIYTKCYIKTLRMTCNVWNQSFQSTTAKKQKNLVPVKDLEPDKLLALYKEKVHFEFVDASAIVKWLNYVEWKSGLLIMHNHI